LTVPATARRAGPFNGNGVTTSFPFTFKVFAAADLAVVVADEDGIETSLVLNSGYSVTLNGDQDASPGGSVTYPITGAALPTGSTLTIAGAIPYDQTLDLPGGGAFSPRAIENALDRTTYQIQQLAEEPGRALPLPLSAAGADTTLPAPEASKVLGWDAAGTALQNYDPAAAFAAAAFANWVAQSFTGDGVRTQFALASAPGSLGNIDVAVGGVTQTATEDYSLAGNLLTFLAPPANGVRVFVRYGGAVAQQVTGAIAEVFTATAGQTVFPLTTPFVPGAGQVRVFIGGVYVRAFVEGTGQVTLSRACTAGDEVVVEVGSISTEAVDASQVGYTAPGGVARSVQAKLTDIYNAEDYGYKTDGTDMGPVMNALIQIVGDAGGGVIEVPAGAALIATTVDNNRARVLIRGAGTNTFHDVPPDTGGTLWYGLSAITLCRHRTPYGGPTAQKNTGGGFVGITLAGNNIATCALLVDSISEFTHELTMLDFAGIPMQFTCGVTGTDLGEACDVQHGVQRLYIRQRFGAAANIDAVYHGGSSNANVSLNELRYVIQHFNGDGVDFFSSDNNDIWLLTYAGGGTGKAAIHRGTSNIVLPYSRGNRFHLVSGDSPMVFEGTDTPGVTVPSNGHIHMLDFENSTPFPTLGTGCVVPVMGANGVLYGTAHTKVPIADTAGNAINARNRLGTEAVRFYSTASNHVVLDDGTNVWGVSIDAGTGDLRMVRAAGSGSVNVGNGAPVKINNKTVTEGAADSGGSGFKVLRVPN
jgi:hypothetical protein